jgi:hypothetical protein
MRDMARIPPDKLRDLQARLGSWNFVQIVSTARREGAI